MEYARDDKEIRELLSEYRLKEPPKSLLQNYEGEVMAKILSLENAPAIPLPVIALSAALILLLGFIWLMILRPEPVYQPTVTPSRVQTPERAAVFVNAPMRQAVPGLEVSRIQPSSKEASEEKAFDQMERDLFILEMLGEDEGLMDDLDRLATDVEFVIQSSPVIG
jgi:hypothetical protein